MLTKSARAVYNIFKGNSRGNTTKIAQQLESESLFSYFRIKNDVVDGSVLGVICYCERRVAPDIVQSI
jgi:hypothetical protein